MRGFLIFIAVLLSLVVGVPLLFLAGFLIDEVMHTYDTEARFRITIEVQHGDQIKTGSGVIGEAFHVFRNFNSGRLDNRTYLTGYAPTVDLGDKGLLLLSFMNATRTRAQWIEQMKTFHCTFDDIGCLPFSAYGLSSGGQTIGEMKAALRTLLKQSGPRDVPFAALPKLFRIMDDDRAYANLPWKDWSFGRDQSWGELIDQLSVQPDDLAARFGQGVVLRRVVVELTNDPVTPQPAIWPHWLTDKAKVAMEAVIYGMRKTEPIDAWVIAIHLHPAASTDADMALRRA
jgi:hypothetical protein